MKFTWTSFKKAATVRTIGSHLEVSLPMFGIENLTAKVDTGAFNGALHATRIREVIKADGQRYLHFSPLGSPDHTLEIEDYHRRRVKSSNGMMSVRYAIDTEIEIRGHVYPITLTLANRGSMRHSMLIGRRFLRLHGFLVDVNHRSK